MTDRKRSNADEHVNDKGWFSLTTLQNLIGPLAERIRHRRRRREDPVTTGVSNPPRETGGESVDDATKMESAHSVSQSGNESTITGTDLAQQFHETLVSSVMQSFVTDGWQPTLPDDEAFGYDLELSRGPEKVAVQVRSQKARVYLPQLRRFEDFLNSSEAGKFSRGFLISTSGFAHTVYAYLDSEGINNIHLGTFENGKLRWYPDDVAEAPQQPREKRYIGVFTCKGGVGKTTVSAHLAGAFALCGYHVVLVDLDRQGNLRKLMGEGIYLPHPRKKSGTTITVLDHHEWDDARDPETGIVICDCNPEFSQNPQELMSRFDYCLIPTTLNPLGMNKNGFIIRKTFQEIRNLNRKTEMFVLINGYDPLETKRNQVLNALMKREFKEWSKADSRCHYIDPDDVCIRYSKQLLYWGYETIIEEAEPQLAFRAFGGRSNPRSDFLALAEFLQSHTDLEQLKQKPPVARRRA